MNKEEAIEQMIKEYKDGVQMAFTNFCVAHTCAECPFVNGCRDAVFNELIERLIKAEEPQKTNLEHFRGNVIFNMAGGEVHINLKNGWKKSYNDHEGIIDWLLSPYEEPKPKYKLSKFEYDLLECYEVNRRISEFWLPYEMCEKGYFKDIPTDVPIGNILDNCEVVEE